MFYRLCLVFVLVACFLDNQLKATDLVNELAFFYYYPENSINDISDDNNQIIHKVMYNGLILDHIFNFLDPDEICHFRRVNTLNNEIFCNKFIVATIRPIETNMSYHYKYLIEVKNSMTGQCVKLVSGSHTNFKSEYYVAVQKDSELQIRVSVQNQNIPVAFRFSSAHCLKVIS